MMSKILVVEDNLALAEGLAYNLRHEGHDVRIAEDGEAAVADSRAWSPDLVILDLMLPKLDGYGVLAAIRETTSDVPVIILSARGEEADKVRGFRLDADQYVTKPFGVLELLERVSALLRRKSRAGATHAADEAIRFGEVVVDVAARTVCRGGAPVTITPKAFELLLALVARGGRVVSRQDLLKEVWGYGAFVLSRTVDSHIAELRRKLEVDPARPRHIVTVWKVGYRFEAS
jgi:two-component system, OmpR family, alkaline phosphatase synthesis response regulator PhoP